MYASCYQESHRALLEVHHINLQGSNSNRTHTIKKNSEHHCNVVKPVANGSNLHYLLPQVSLHCSDIHYSFLQCIYVYIQITAVCANHAKIIWIANRNMRTRASLKNQWRWMRFEFSCNGWSLQGSRKPLETRMGRHSGQTWFMIFIYL